MTDRKKEVQESSNMETNSIYVKPQREMIDFGIVVASGRRGNKVTIFWKDVKTK